MNSTETSSIGASALYNNRELSGASVTLDKFNTPPGIDSGVVFHSRTVKRAVRDSMSMVEPSVVTSRRPQKSTGVASIHDEQTESVLLAEWDGYVLSYNEHSFLASMKGVHGDGVLGEQEDAEIPIQDISESDLELLQPGAVFRLCVFRSISRTGQPRRFTEVVFRRVAAFRPKLLEAAKVRANLIVSKLRVE